jgi:solute carrier family 25 (mitochondrial uncoupling protein), member 8/9
MEPFTVLKEVAAAGIGCAIADSIFNPLEIVKVRLQVLNGDATVISSRGFVQELLTIIRNDGFVNLWTPGLTPTFLRGFLYAGSRIGMYPTVKNFINDNVTLTTKADNDSNRDIHFVTKLLAGALCGAVGSLIFSPLDLIRINFQKNPKCYPSTAAAFIQIFNKDGFSGLWRGSSATVIRATLLSGCQLSIYDQLKTCASVMNDHDGTKSVTPWLQEGPFLHASASFTSGVIAQAVIMPIDAIKTNIMVMNSNAVTVQESNLSQLNLSDRPATIAGAFSKILREGGLRGFYRGFSPAILRQGPCILIQVSLLRPLTFVLLNTFHLLLLCCISTYPSQMPLIEQLRRMFNLEYM